MATAKKTDRACYVCTGGMSHTPWLCERCLNEARDYAASNLIPMDEAITLLARDVREILADDEADRRAGEGETCDDCGQPLTHTHLHSPSN